MKASKSNLHGRIPSLDGLRALSIMLVLIGHVVHSLSEPIKSMETLIQFAGINSNLGVMTFFVISGYLITHLLRREIEKTSTINFKAFFRRRVLRIFPAFYSYILVVALLSLLGVLSISGRDILLAATYTWNYSTALVTVSKDAAWYLGHFWTLALEEQFYLFWPLVLLLVGEKKGARLAAALILVAPIVRVLTYLLFPSLRGQIGMMLHTACDAMMFGCVASLWQGTPKMTRFILSLQNGLLPALAFVVAFFVVPVITMKAGGMFMLPVGMSLMGFCIVTVLLWAINYPESAIGRLLNAPPLVLVGVLSYSLYLWQQLFLGPLNKTWTGIFPLNLLCCFAAALASYYLIERPFLLLKDRKTKTVPLPEQPVAPQDVHAAQENTGSKIHH